VECRLAAAVLARALGASVEEAAGVTTLKELEGRVAGSSYGPGVAGRLAAVEGELHEGAYMQEEVRGGDWVVEVCVWGKGRGFAGGCGFGRGGSYMRGHDCRRRWGGEGRGGGSMQGGGFNLRECYCSQHGLCGVCPIPCPAPCQHKGQPMCSAQSTLLLPPLMQTQVHFPSNTLTPHPAPHAQPLPSMSDLVTHTPSRWRPCWARR
jgi:hypothetical protein